MSRHRLKLVNVSVQTQKGLARYPVKCQVEVQILMSMENGVNIGLFLHRLVQN